MRRNQVRYVGASSTRAVALAWHLHEEPITAPIVGVSEMSHLEDAVATLDVLLSANDVEYPEEPCEPKPVEDVFVGPSDGPFRPLDAA